MKKMLAMLLVSMMVMSLAGCGEKTAPTEATTEPATEEPTTEEPTTEPMPEETILHLNEATTVGSFEFTITNVEFIKDQYRTRLSGNSTVLHETDGYFICVDYLVKNIGKKSQYTPMECMTVDYNDGYVFDVYKSYHGVTSDFDGYNYSEEMAPLSEAVSMRTYFEVPDEVHDSDKPLFIRISTGREEAFYYIRPTTDK